jgi:hypothetical protein
LSPPFL